MCTTGEERSGASGRAKPRAAVHVAEGIRSGEMYCGLASVLRSKLKVQKWRSLSAGDKDEAADQTSGECKSYPRTPVMRNLECVRSSMGDGRGNANRAD